MTARPGRPSTTRPEVAEEPDITIVPTSAPALPRLFLTRAPAKAAVLHGGWWPYSFDPQAELPGLVLALCARYGSIREISLPTGDWQGPFSRLAMDAGIVRMAWSTALDPALLIATTPQGQALTLLVVAPHTDAAIAKRALTMAADPANRLTARDILAAAG